MLTEDMSLKTVTFDKSKLLSVSKDGFEYVDDQGCRCAIDFHICRENFQKVMHVPRDEEDVYVGFYELGTLPHITFATNPPTRFIFPPGPSAKVRGGTFQNRAFHEAVAFQIRLFNEAGVRTFDPT